MKLLEIILIIVLWLGVWSIVDIIVDKLSKYIHKDYKDYIRLALYIIVIVIIIVYAKLFGIELR